MNEFTIAARFSCAASACHPRSNTGEYGWLALKTKPAAPPPDDIPPVVRTATSPQMEQKET
ncbi:hypothetical protein SSBR45G_16820 [Bradyrhizobium sp. SSBR45G]|nr:hypothetical protein SSBR45G_16820 [Bradyrhizobium sp. SSBR45G]GLH83532.1 hypothetical protein SSBR45R_09920 [Bradyrhizobium sp. SSBR45R]